LSNFSADLADKPRWLIINKTDLLPADKLAIARQKLLSELAWEGPVFEVSAATGEGTEALGQAIMRGLEHEADDTT
jgi:GTP-binding protein